MIATSSTPVKTPVSSEGSAARCKPFCKMVRKNRPSSVPHSVPRPPKTEVPPKTTAVSRVQLIPGSCIRFRLSQMRHIDDGGQAGHQTGQKIHQSKACAHGNAGVARSRSRESNGVESAADHGAMQKNPIAEEHRQKEEQLNGNHAQQIALPKKQKALRKVCCSSRCLV